MAEPDTTEPFLSMREAVMEVRRDVKEIGTNMVTKSELAAVDGRLRKVENSGLRFAGVRATIVMGISGLAGLAGLVLGSLSVAHYYFT